MRKFAFIIFVDTIEALKRIHGLYRALPSFAVGAILKNKPAIEIFHARNITCGRGEKIDGHIILCPLFPNKYMGGLHMDFVMDRINSAGNLAKKLGADIVGFDTLPQAVSDKEQVISDTLKIPITTGRALTAWSMFEAAYRITKAKRIPFSQTVITVLGANKPLAQLCAFKCSSLGARLVIFDWNQEKLVASKERLLKFLCIANKPEALTLFAKDNLALAVAEADIIINADNFDEGRFLNNTKRSATVLDLFGCDAKPLNRTSANNVNFIKAALIKMPHLTQLGFHTGLPEGVICSGLSETMLLTYEGKFVNYSIGDNINPDDLEEIADMAAAHGFEVWLPEAPVI